MKETKVQYFDKVKKLKDNYRYISQVSIQGVSQSLIQKLLKEAQKHQISSLKSKFNIASKVIPIRKGDTIILASSNKQKLLSFLKMNKIVSYSFYNQGDIAQEDITIPKGNLRLKAGTIMNLFEKFGSIKLTKGMIELLQPIDIVKKGNKISKEGCKILQLLDKKLKTSTIKTIQIQDLVGGTIYSEDLLAVVSSEEVDLKISKFIKLLHIHSPYSFLNRIPFKLAKIIHHGFNKFPKSK